MDSAYSVAMAVVFGGDEERAERNARGIVEGGYTDPIIAFCKKCGLEKYMDKEETVTALVRGLKCCGEVMKVQ